VTRSLHVPKLLDRKHSVFTLSEVLSAQECQDLILWTEREGYSEAPINTAFGMQRIPEVRNNERVMVDDHQRADWLWERLREHLPLEWEGWRVVGLNERLRYYRYHPGQYFRWHHDGCFRRSREERSMLTLMVYLNDDFLGGETQFDVGLRHAVRPERGSALVFEHQVRHQGEEVFDGTKYVLRTDVMYRRR
jgi:prolyl 4-hydroxylase